MGSFNSELEAAQAYDYFAVLSIYQGMRAKTNFSYTAARATHMIKNYD